MKWIELTREPIFVDDIPNKIGISIDKIIAFEDNRVRTIDGEFIKVQESYKEIKQLIEE